MDSKGDLLAGVVVGAVIGALAGIMFAPAPGKETREKVADKSMELKEKAVLTAREHKEATEARSKEVIDELRKKLPNTKDVKDALDAAERELFKES